MSRPPRAIPATLPCAFTHAEGIAAGVSSERLAGGRVFSRDGLASERELVLAWGRTLPPGWALSHHAAAVALGLPLPGRRPPRLGFIEVPLHATGPRGTRPRRTDADFHLGVLHRDDLVIVEGVLVTRPARTFADLGSHLPLLDLVPLGDVALAQENWTTEQMARYCEPVRRGRVRLATAIPLLNKDAETAQESRTRILMHLAGLPVPEVQVDLYDDDGHFVGRADLYVREYLTMVEHLGRDHFDEEKTPEEYDPARRARAHRAGYEYVELTATSILRKPLVGLGRVAEALRARGWSGVVDHAAVEEALGEARRMPVPWRKPPPPSPAAPLGPRGGKRRSQWALTPADARAPAPRASPRSGAQRNAQNRG